MCRFIRGGSVMCDERCECMFLRECDCGNVMLVV